MTTATHVRSGDIMLRWASEQESGTWRQFRHAAATVLAASNDVKNAATLAARMSELGHLDLDWNTGRWSIAPPVVAVARGMGMCVYLAGWRTSWLESRFDQATDDLDIYPLEHPHRGAPAAKFAKCGSIEAIEELSKRLHLRIVWDPSAQLAELVSLPTIGELSLGAPPFGEDQVEFFDSGAGKFNKVATTSAEGLYLYEVNGQPAHRLHIDGDWRIVDRAAGMLHLLRGQSVMRWHKQSPDLTIARAVTVPKWLALPAMAERALVSATGLRPVYRGDRRVYRNVSRVVAQRVADGLNVALDIATDPLPAPPLGAA